MAKISKLRGCDPVIFTTGIPLFCADTGSCGAEYFDNYIRDIRNFSGCPIDWHYSGGRAQVLFMDEHHRDKLTGLVMHKGGNFVILEWFPIGAQGLHRAANVVPAHDKEIDGRLEEVAGKLKVLRFEHKCRLMELVFDDLEFERYTKLRGRI